MADTAQARVSIERYEADLKLAREEGLKEGRIAGREEAINWLQSAYLDDEGRPDRGTPKAEAILEIAKDLVKYLQSKVDK